MITVITLVSLIAAYFIPTFVAIRNKHKHLDAICVTNIMFGWTGILWLVCLIWACWV